MQTRARDDDAKQQRREVILKAALKLFQATDYERITMDAVAKAAKLAKGTLYLYFSTREHLFLGLLEREIAEWFDAIDAALGQEKTRWNADHAARVICDSFRGRELLLRLLALLETVLEKNIDVETAAAFKRMLLNRLATAGAGLERHLHSLEPGEGVHLLLHIRALLCGLQQASNPSAVVDQVLKQDCELSVLRMDFEREFYMGTAAVIRGWVKEHKA